MRKLQTKGFIMNEKSKTMQTIIWLVLAVILSFLAGGDSPVELAVWLSPVFLLRFFRMSKPLKGFLIAIPCLTLASVLSSKGMSLAPVSVFIVTRLIASIIDLLPFFLDRLLAPRMKGGLKTLLLPGFVVVFDFLVSLGSGLGTWGIQAYGVQDLVWLQLASITGIWGITFIIYWTAGVINEAWENWKNIKEIRRLLISFVVVLIIVYGYGVFRLHETSPGEHSVRVAGVTPVPAQREIVRNAVGLMLLNNSITETQARQVRSLMDYLFQDLMNQSIKMAKSGVEIVVWSEGAARIFAADEDQYLKQACSAAKENGIYLGLSVIVLTDDAPVLFKKSQPFFKNKLIFISPGGNIAWEHLKGTLVPGLEDKITIPGDGILKTANVPVIPVGPVTGAICYELDFPRLIRQAGKSGSSLLLAPSNDWAEVKHMHAAMARMRAIENGLAVFRPTSQGISIAVDPYGRIVSQVDYFQSKGGPIAAVLPVKPVSTLYSSIGDLFAWLVLIGTMALFIGGLIRYKSLRRPGALFTNIL
jgi:apolipoprotein N-acyltransferase